MRRRILKGFLLILLFLILVGVPFTTLTHQGRVMVKTALFIPQIFPGNPVKPLQWFTPKPIVEEVTYPTPSGQGVADLYRPGRKGQYGAVLLFLGVNPAGRDDPRVVNLGNALARAGMVVMIPWSESMVEKRIEVSEVDNLVAAFQYLRGLPFVDHERVGMGGFCVGASISFIAAARPEIRDQVSFINFFGGYYNAVDLIKAESSRYSYYQGRVAPWEPDDLTQEVVATHLIEGVPNEEERRLLTSIFVEGKGTSEGIVEGLSAEALVVYRLLQGVSLEEADEVISQLPTTVRERLNEISPSTFVSQIQSKVLIMHDREDDLVPVEESRRLSDVLSSNGKVYFTEFSSFRHVTPTIGFTFIRELFKLYTHFYNIFILGA